MRGRMPRAHGPCRSHAPARMRPQIPAWIYFNVDREPRTLMVEAPVPTSQA
jgi:hypothetical protein